jgi:hypothetical protein
MLATDRFLYYTAEDFRIGQRISCVSFDELVTDRYSEQASRLDTGMRLADLHRLIEQQIRRLAPTDLLFYLFAMSSCTLGFP